MKTLEQQRQPFLKTIKEEDDEGAASSNHDAFADDKAVLDDSLVADFDASFPVQDAEEKPEQGSRQASKFKISRLARRGQRRRNEVAKFEKSSAMATRRDQPAIVNSEDERSVKDEVLEKESVEFSSSSASQDKDVAMSSPTEDTETVLNVAAERKNRRQPVLGFVEPGSASNPSFVDFTVKQEQY